MEGEEEEIKTKKNNNKKKNEGKTINLLTSFG